jgi:hypothetical protein
MPKISYRQFRFVMKQTSVIHNWGDYLVSGGGSKKGCRSGQPLGQSEVA